MLAWSAFRGEARAVLVSRLTGVAVLKWSLFDAMAVVASLLWFVRVVGVQNATYHKCHRRDLVVVGGGTYQITDQYMTRCAKRHL